MRHDGRNPQQLRKVTLQTNVFHYPEGSVVIRFGNTIVSCSATIEAEVPSFLQGTGTGELIAQYHMFPRATRKRNMETPVEDTMIIQHLIERSLRAVVDLEKLGERSIVMDCDVLQADGGLQAASITGAFVALRLAVDTLLQKKVLQEDPINEPVVSVNVGLFPEGVYVDLDEKEEKFALAKMNLVMTESGKFIEIQGRGVGSTFDGEQLNEMLFYGKSAMEQLILEQKSVMFKPLQQERGEPLKTIIIATRNTGKAQEFKTMFGRAGYEVKTLADYPELPDVEETGSTFEENARLKAETIAYLLNQPVLADDSGLKVDALGGMPGIYSARFAGEHKSDAGNNAKLLYELTDVPDEKRTAQFHCTLVFAASGKESLVVEAQWSGRIGRIPKGENGFGYDPLFIPNDSTKTAAEMSSEEKNKMSHRGQAMAKLSQKWQKWLEGER